MRRYRGNATVDPGLYFNFRRLSFKSVQERGRLPGREEDVYHRVPTLALLFVGPVLGLVFVIFLPFIGFVMVGWLLAEKAGYLVVEATRAGVRVLRPGWEPSLAFLSRSKGTKARAESDTWAEEARKKLDRDDAGAAQ